MDVLDILIDALRAAVLITGMVVIMMMMIESLNISSGGRFFQRLRNSKFGQIVVSALLGWIPGCLGGFASVSLFSHGMISFGALVAMLIATSGDEAFVMLTLFPGKALLISAIILAVGIAAGVLIDYVGPKLGLKPYALTKRKSPIRRSAPCSPGNGASSSSAPHSTSSPSPPGCSNTSTKGWKRPNTAASTC